MKRVLKDKSIWLVGASTGIGADLARELAARGARITLSARSTEKLEALATEIGDRASVLPLDVSDQTAIQKAVETVGSVDGVVYLAAAYNPDKMDATVDLDRIHSTVTVNLTGAICLSECLRKTLSAREDSFLAIYASLAGYRGLPNGQPYSATKAALINYAESLRAELSGQVDVKVINSGFVDTRLTQRNAFKMPMLMTSKDAARKVADGLERDGFEISFPFRFACMLKLVRVLPNWAFFKLTSRLAG